MAIGVQHSEGALPEGRLVAATQQQCQACLQGLMAGLLGGGGLALLTGMGGGGGDG